MSVSLVPVSSSNVAAVGYDPLLARLYVQFHNGSLYAYDGVPAYIHQQLMMAPSHGRYLQHYVRGVYPAAQLA